MALADTFASKEREEAERPSGREVPETPLSSPFSRICLPMDTAEASGEAVGFSPVHPLGEGLKRGAPYPTERPNIHKDVYGRLEEHLHQRMAALRQTPPKTPHALLLSLATVLQETASLIPADTQAEPDVSLYDHLRLTAAIAHALWLYHRENPSVEDLRRDGEKFLLVVGDLGGIQGHIYRVAGAETGVGGIAKRLRARSLEVSLAAEAMALGLLRKVGLTPLNRIMSAGGKFYLLLPNTQEAKAALQAHLEDWEKWAFKNGASLLPYLAWAPFAGKEFAQFDQVFCRVHQALAEAKLRPLRFLQSTPDTLRPALRPCAACGLRPALQDEPGALCEECQRERDVGGRLPRAQGVAFHPEGAPPPYFGFPGLQVSLWDGTGPAGSPFHVQRGRPDFSPDGLSLEVKPLLGHLPTVADALEAEGKSLEEYQAWVVQEGLFEEEEEVTRERPLTFSELAALAKGVPYLGGLLLDADRMGEVFARGLRCQERDLATPSRIAALSRFLEWFFTVEVLGLIQEASLYQGRLGWSDLEAQNKARRYRLIYSVYSGGDDLFLLGPWDVLLDFALDLESLYRHYVRHPALTLSGGFQLFGGKVPVPSMAQALQEAETAAKNAGRGRLFLFGRAVPWDTLRDLRQNWMEPLRQHLKDKRVSKAQVYRWLGLWRRFWDGVSERPREPEEGYGERMRYKPLLAYALRRIREQDESAWKQYLRLLDHQEPAWHHLPVWVQWALYRERGD